MQVGRKILQLHFSSRLCYNAATERGEPFNGSEGMAAVWRGDARLEDVELEPAGDYEAAGARPVGAACAFSFDGSSSLMVDERLISPFRLSRLG